MAQRALAIAAELPSTVKGLFRSQNDQWVLAPDANCQGFDLKAVLEALEEWLGGRGGELVKSAPGREGDEWVRMLVGGITVLGVDCDWVRKWREVHRTGAVRFPMKRAMLQLTTVAEHIQNQKADLLAVGLAALNDSPLQLGRAVEDFESQTIQYIPRVFRAPNQRRKDLQLKSLIVERVFDRLPDEESIDRLMQSLKDDKKLQKLQADLDLDFEDALGNLQGDAEDGKPWRASLEAGGS